MGWSDTSVFPDRVVYVQVLGAVHSVKEGGGDHQPVDLLCRTHGWPQSLRGVAQPRRREPRPLHPWAVPDDERKCLSLICVFVECLVSIIDLFRVVWNCGWGIWSMLSTALVPKHIASCSVFLKITRNISRIARDSPRSNQDLPGLVWSLWETHGHFGVERPFCHC